MQKLRRCWPNAKVTTANCKESEEIRQASRLSNHGTYQPGGVAQFTLGKQGARLRESGSDHTDMGRWAFQRFTGPSGKEVYVITAYRVGQTSAVSAGELTAAKQQWRSMISEGNPNPNPRAAFITDLIEWIDHRRTSNTEFIVMLDANERLDGPGMQTLLEAADLEDLHARHPNQPEFQGRTLLRPPGILCRSG